MESLYICTATSATRDRKILQGVVQEMEVTILDVLGKEVKKFNVGVTLNNVKINVRLVSGVYTIKMKNKSNETVIKQLLVQ